MIPFGILVPVSVLSFGLVNRFIEGKIGLGLSLVFLFFNGGGVSRQIRFIHISEYFFGRTNLFIIKVDMTYAACVAYMVDVMQSRSSEILAAIKFVLFFLYKF